MEQLQIPGLEKKTHQKYLTWSLSALLIALSAFFPLQAQQPALAPQVLGQAVERIAPAARQINPPILKADAARFSTKAFSALAIDLGTGKVLLEKNSQARWPTASLAKLMAAIVTINLVSQDVVVEVAGEDISAPQPVMGLVAGEKITVGDLLKGMLISSTNDASITLSRAVTGSKERFVELMNLMANQLQLKDTHFQNASGFDDPLQYSTADDLAKLAMTFLKVPSFAEIAKTKQTQVTAVDGSIRHWLVSTNKLLGQDNIEGVKTGLTEKARGNLILLAGDGNGHKILTVVLGSDNREADSAALVKWTYNAYDF